MASPLVDFGFLTGADISTDYLRIGHPIYGRIGTGKIAPNDLLSDYSDRLMAMSVERTSTRSVGPLVEYNAGTATLELLNDDGALDPVNLAHPAPGVAVRIRQAHNGTTYPVYRGFVKSWVPEHRSPNHSVIVVTATDGFDRIAGYERGPSVAAGAGEDTGARLHRILDSVGWPASERDIATGDSTLQATTLEGDALDEAQRAVRAEVGEFYVDEVGNMFFRNRRGLLTEARSNTSQATFGLGVGEIKYVDRLGVSYDDEQFVNLVRATRIGGVEQVAEDADSRSRYRDKPAGDQELMLETDTAAASWARYVLRQDALPQFRITSLTLDARLEPEHPVFAQALGRRMGDRITVVRRPPGVVDSRELFIRSISHSWSSPDVWRTTWGLESASKYEFFVIGHPLLGRVGRNRIAF